jgi:hypothetical protein
MAKFAKHRLESGIAEMLTVFVGPLPLENCWWRNATARVTGELD